MKSLVFAIAACLSFVPWAQSAYAQKAPEATQCTGGLIKHYWNTMHVQIDSGTPDTKADNRPDTLQVVLAKKLAPGEGKVSDDGQIIYTSPKAMNDQANVDRFMQEALIRRIRSGSHVDCSTFVHALLNSHSS